MTSTGRFFVSSTPQIEEGKNQSNPPFLSLSRKGHRRRVCAVVVIVAAIGIRLRLSPSLIDRRRRLCARFVSLSSVVTNFRSDIMAKNRSNDAWLEASRIAHKYPVSERHREGPESPTLKQMASLQ